MDVITFMAYLLNLFYFYLIIKAKGHKGQFHCSKIHTPVQYCYILRWYIVEKTVKKNEYTARNSQHVIVKNLLKFTLCSRFLRIHRDGDFTTSLDRLFQASMTLLLKSTFYHLFIFIYFYLNIGGKGRKPLIYLYENEVKRKTSHYRYPT